LSPLLVLLIRRFCSSFPFASDAHRDAFGPFLPLICQPLLFRLAPLSVLLDLLSLPFPVDLIPLPILFRLQPLLLLQPAVFVLSFLFFGLSLLFLRAGSGFVVGAPGPHRGRSGGEHINSRRGQGKSLRFMASLLEAWWVPEQTIKPIPLGFSLGPFL